MTQTETVAKFIQHAAKAKGSKAKGSKATETKVKKGSKMAPLPEDVLDKRMPNRIKKPKKTTVKSKPRSAPETGTGTTSDAKRALAIAAEWTEHNNRVLRDVRAGRKPHSALRYEDEGGEMKRVGWPDGYRPELAKSIAAHERLFSSRQQVEVGRVGAAVSTRGIDLTKKVRLLVPGNPKRPGSRAHAAWVYRDGMTLAEVFKVGAPKGYTRADLRWDLEHGFITLE